MKKYIFIGSLKFSALCLDALLKAGVNIISILCLNKEAALFNSDYCDFKDVANKFKRKIYYFKNIAYEADYIRSLEPDFIFVLGFSQLIPEDILSIPAIGTVGCHAALLPYNRGRHPIIWAIANGLKKSGVTLFWMNKEIDAGDILDQQEFLISEKDDAGSVYRKVTALVIKMLKKNIPLLEKGVAGRIKQDHSKANYWRRRSQEDGRIDWRMSSQRIYDLIRALSFPYLGAHFVYKGKKHLVWSARICGGAVRFLNLEPGRVISIKGLKITIKTGDGAIEIIKHEINALPAVGACL